MPSLSANKIKGNNPLVRLVDSVGDGTGTTDLSLDFSGASTQFRVSPSGNKVFYIAQIVLSFSTTGQISPSDYGGGNALVNGIQLMMRKDGVTSPLFPQLTSIINNFQMVTVASNLNIIDYAGTTNGFRAVLDFTSMGLDSIILNGRLNDEIIVELNDNFTTRVISGQQFIACCGSAN